MPQAFARFVDKRTSKTYDMPWSDVTTKPTRDQKDTFVRQQEEQANRGPLRKFGDWATTPLANIGSRIGNAVGEPLLQYSEGQPLSMFGRQIAGARKPGESEGMGRTASRYAGAFAETFGEGLDTLTAPFSLATMGAAPVGKGLQAVGGAGLAGRVGSALTAVPRAAGYGMMGHGLYSAQDRLRNPSGQGVIEDLKGPAIETALGYFGSRAPKPTGSVVEPPPSTGRGLPNMVESPYMPAEPFGRPLQRGVDPSSIGNMRPPVASGRPTTRELIHDSPPAQQYPYVTDVELESFEPNVTQGRNYGTDNLANFTPTTEPAYIKEIKDTFDRKIGGRRGVADSPPPTPRSSLERIQRTEQELTKTRRLQAEIDAENKAAGFKSSPKKAQAGIPDEATIEAESLRNPYSEERAKYPKAVIEHLDAETLTNPEIGKRLPKGVLSDLRKKVASSPTMRRLMGQRGAVEMDLSGLSDSFGKGAQKIKGAVASARQKALNNIADAEATGVFGAATKGVTAARKTAAALTGPDVTDASFASYYRSGWGYLEKMGEPGQKLARILKRERIDVSHEQSGLKQTGKELLDAKGKPVNRTGKIIYDRNKEQIDDLIKQIKDPEQQKQAKDILDDFTGANPDPQSSFKKGTDAIKGIEGLTKLSQFGIGNIAGAVPIKARNSLATTLRAARKVLPGIGDKAAMAEAENSLLLGHSVSPTMADSGAGGLAKLSDKLFRISGSEKRMRSMAVLAGRDTAQETFAKLKANPTSKALRRQLDDLILEDDMDAVLKQSKLTTKQIDRAGGRMNELTQGLAEGIDLPPGWKGKDLATQFKKYAFVQGRNTKEAALANPGRTAAALAVAAPVVGEIIGDAKSTIKGVFKGTTENKKDLEDYIAEEFHKRGKDVPTRLLANLDQAWALGLGGEMYQAAKRGPAGFAAMVGGPAIGDIGEAMSGLYQYGKTGQNYHLKRQAASAVPYIGTAWSNTIKGSYKGRQVRRKREKRSRDN